MRPKTHEEDAPRRPAAGEELMGGREVRHSGPEERRVRFAFSRSDI